MHGGAKLGGGGSAGFAMRHSRAVVLVVLGICAWGGAAIFLLASGIYPNVAFPRIVIIAERGDDSVENMQAAVTRPLEDSATAVQGLIRVRSKTVRGAVEMSLDFSQKTDMLQALSETRARANSAVGSLSPPVSLIIERQTPSVAPVISYIVTLKPGAGGALKDGADLLNWAQLTLKPRISRLPDVYQVALQGADERQVQVLADPARLAAAGLSLDDIAKRLEEGNQVGAVGIMEKDYLQYQLLASSQFQSIDQIAALPVTTKNGKTIHLGDLAEVKMGLADRTMAVTGNGKDAIGLSIFMRYGGKVTQLSDNIKMTLADIEANLPEGVSIEPVYDQADLVRDAIGGVREAILIGMGLTVLVLFAFLASWRLTLVAAISIPISVLATFAFMLALGESLNLMTLGGIAVAIGLIIDDAIVVVENIARKLHHRGDRKASIIEATQEIFGAVVGSSLTTVVVFLPLALLEGIVGQFFQALAMALGIGIMVSMAVSLTLTPLMSAGPLGPRAHERTDRRWMDFLAGIYVWFARRALQYPWLSALIIIGVLAAGGWAAREQQTDFLPEMDEGAFVLDYTMPVGTSLGETDKNCRKIEAILQKNPDIASYSRRTGAELGFFATEQFTGDFLVGLKPRKEREHAIDEVIGDLRGKIETDVPQIEVEFVQIMQDTLNDLAGEASPLEVKVFGPDYRVLQELATTIAGRIGKIKGIVDVESGVTFGNPELTYHIDSDAASLAGLSDADVQRQLASAIDGAPTTEMRQGEQLIPVVVRYPDSVRRDPLWLENLPIANAAGKTIPASSVAKLDSRIAINELNRENQQPVVSVTANLDGIDLGSAAAKVGTVLKGIAAPPSVHIELGGQILSKKKSDSNMAMVLGLACGLVFLLLVIQFRSYRLPLVIFLTLPASQIGALLALRLTGESLNIASEMGLVMLIGLVVKNGIIFIEYTAQLRGEGMPTLREALIQAGRVRLRPILMTSLCAIIAMLPLAFNLGAGAELQRPLAIAVIGGLSVSTFFTLLIVPVAHMILGESHELVALPEKEAEE